MGIFDNIHCEYPLPDCPENIELDWQTKCLGCCLDTYVITEDGRLTQDNGTGRMVDLYYHGMITFYTSIGRGKDLEWVQYRAKFTDGQLVEVERQYVNWNDIAYPKGKSDVRT
jgi:hypothetical protein